LLPQPEEEGSFYLSLSLAARWFKRSSMNFDEIYGEVGERAQGKVKSFYVLVKLECSFPLLFPSYTWMLM